MKKIMLLMFTFLSLNSLAQNVQNIDYISPMNFNMPAIEVDSRDVDTVKIIIKEAVLNYPDRGFNFEQTNKLKQVFNMQRLNSLIITFPKILCRTKDGHEVLVGQIISCNYASFGGTSAKMEVKGALTDFAGRLIDESDVKVMGRIGVDIAHFSVVSAELENKFLKVRVAGQLFDQHIDEKVIPIFLNKSNISPRNP